jgi:hypothetical protein
MEFLREKRPTAAPSSILSCAMQPQIMASLRPVFRTFGPDRQLFRRLSSAKPASPVLEVNVPPILDTMAVGSVLTGLGLAEAYKTTRIFV